MMALCGLILGRCIVLLLILEILILGFRYRYTLFTAEEQNISVNRVTNSYPIELEEHEDRSVADELATKVRVLCWVMTNSKTLEKARHVKATWGKRCNKLLFMSTTEDESLPTVNLPVEEGTHYLWGKTKAAFNYVYQHYRNEADWFLKADDDTYVIVENLRYMLSKYDSNKPLYFGCRFKVNNQSYMSGGAGYLLSRAALESLVEDGLSGSYLCKWRNIGLEDLLLGKCLEALGVTSVDTRDSLRRGRFYPFTLYDHMFPTINKDFWYWHYVYYPADDGPNCCSDLAISFHYISPQHMHELEYYVYRLRPFGINYNTRILPIQTNKEHLPPGKELQWPIWKSLNRLRTQVGRCRSNLAKWGIIDPTEVQCKCGAPLQSMLHLLSCPLCPTTCIQTDLMKASKKAVGIATYKRRKNV